MPEKKKVSSLAVEKSEKISNEKNSQQLVSNLVVDKHYFFYQQVHQPKLGNDLVLVDVEPGVHEEVVHLHEGEHHVEDRVDAGEDVPRAAAHRNLKDQRSPFV